MLLEAVAATSDDLAATAARGAKISRLATLLAASATPDESRLLVRWLAGELTQRQLGVGWASVRELPAPAENASLTVRAVEAAFEQLASTTGAGSQALRRSQLAGLLAAATRSEQSFLVRLLTGELRQGALAGLMTDAIAAASGRPQAEVRRAAMLAGDLAAVAADALHGPPDSLAGYYLRVGRPVSPMLAKPAADLAAALDSIAGPAGLEWKLDGIRVQIHRAGTEVAIFTRTLDEITCRLPQLVEAVRALPAGDLVADGELIALRADGRPRPFQVTAARLSSQQPSELAITLFLFDLLRWDDQDLIDQPAEHRRAALERLVGPDGTIRQTPRLVTADPVAAAAFLDDALARGHEGVLVKSLEAPYQAGRRGTGWLKVKPVHTLDLVVLAVERGSGRRTGTLSNIHLGARAADGSFVMVGKTFKGMTDAMLAWQTQRFQELADGPDDGWVVRLRPEQVVEIAFDGAQRSRRYPGGVALRFARVLRYRQDKPAAEADSIETVQSFLIDNTDDAVGTASPAGTDGTPGTADTAGGG